MITGRFVNLRKWALCLGVFCLGVCCLACTSAVACMQRGERSIFFDHVPTDVDAPVVMEATVYDETQVGDARGDQMILMNARVDRVIKGTIEARYLRIFVYLGGCTRVGIGQGIVVGTLRDDPVRGVMLEAVEGADMRAWSEDFSRRQTDIFRTATCWKTEDGVRECRLTGTGPEWTPP